MPFVPVAGVTAITIDWTYSGVPCVNTFHYHTGELTADQIQAVCTTVMNYVETNWLPDIPDTVQLVKVRGRGLWSASAPENQVSPAFSAHGIDATGALPNHASFAVKRKTGLSGRKNRGRLYWIGLSNNMMADHNTVSAAQADGFVADCNGLLVAVAAATPGGPEVLVNRSTGATVNVSGYAYTDLFVDSQRRRLPGHNIHH